MLLYCAMLLFHRYLRDMDYSRHIGSQIIQFQPNKNDSNMHKWGSRAGKASRLGQAGKPNMTCRLGQAGKPNMACRLGPQMYLF